MKRHIQVSTLGEWLCSKWVGLFSGRKEVHLLQISGDVMNSPIKIMKRDDRVTPDIESSSAKTNRKRTTEVIVKSWIIESRERRRAALNCLQDAIRLRETESTWHGQEI